MSDSGQIASFDERSLLVRLTPIVTMRADTPALPQCASSGLMHRSKLRPRIATPHSMTSSESASRPAGMVRSSVFAVLRLMNNSSFVDSSTGKSAGLAPLKILST
jgi:hypothetical protein